MKFSVRVWRNNPHKFQPTINEEVENLDQWFQILLANSKTGLFEMIVIVKRKDQT